jgi:hypothetical protein
VLVDAYGRANEHERRFAIAWWVHSRTGCNPQHCFNFIQNRGGKVGREMIHA